MYDFFVDENGNRVTGQKNIGGAWYYFSPAQIKDEFGPDGYYYCLLYTSDAADD